MHARACDLHVRLVLFLVQVQGLHVASTVRRAMTALPSRPACGCSTAIEGTRAMFGENRHLCSKRWRKPECCSSDRILGTTPPVRKPPSQEPENGRASCRERVWRSVLIPGGAIS